MSETLRDRLEYLIEGVSASALPRWPPDVFCLCAAVLQASGAYSSIVEDAPPQGVGTKRQARHAEVKKIGSRWRQVALSKRALPAKALKWWDTVIAHVDAPLSEVATCDACTLALLNLMAASDEACLGLGVFFPLDESATHSRDHLEAAAELLLLETGKSPGGATLCKQISPSKGRVLPKMHAPQNGLTIRSLSHSLAYSYSPDVAPEWLSAARDTRHHCFNLLVIPWPMQVEPKQFRPTRTKNISDSITEHSYGLFTFDASEGPTIEVVRSMVKEAERRIGPVDGIIFPELAMSKVEFTHLKQEFVTEERFLIAGVGRAAKSPQQCGTNEALLELGLRLGPDLKMTTTFNQKKHHRWKLTKSQILQYGLAGTLHPEADWWEHIEVSGRTIAFVSFRPWLTMSVLICEDLARPDPVGDVLRAVGPSLIVALLCDGPQLMDRWPGRYAGAFADDPGSSVLTVTSLGSARLSKPLKGGENRNRTVALWRDAKHGAKEIDLPENSDALLLSISVEYQQEWTADGRSCGKKKGYPILAGIHPISIDNEAGKK